MTNQYSAKLKPVWLALSVVLFAPLAVQAAGSARIDFAVGGVVVSTVAGAQRSLSKGAEVLSGETVRTAADGRAQLRFDDGAMVSLRPETEFRLDDYHFSGKQDDQGRGFFSLLKGGLRTITGLIGRNNRNAYELRTTVATIGIRGTEYSLVYLDQKRLVVSVGVGEIDICNRTGCTQLVGGESAEVTADATLLFRRDVVRIIPPFFKEGSELPIFSVSEGRDADGGLLVAPVPNQISQPPYVPPPYVPPPYVPPPYDSPNPP